MDKKYTKGKAHLHALSECKTKTKASSGMSIMLADS
jgi:hypothetical protein